jgi:amidase/aspartyl-tRNA(Asn)/glutamyl-tRNA(Gln) amidotransferase subunit A
MKVEEMFSKIGTYSASERRAVFAAFRTRDLLEETLQNYETKNKALAGHLCFVKDNFDLPGFSTGASSLFLEDVRSGPHLAGKLVQRLEALGLAIAGKTHMNEFAYGLDGANPHFGNCPHPSLPGCCSGGSSSGSAWVVANEVVPIAFGTDTGGSIRVPAAFCGLVGFRLPPDEWARQGCFPLAPSFDSVGWFTKNIHDLNFYTRQLLELPEAKGVLKVSNGIAEHDAFTPFIRSQFPQATSFAPFASEEIENQRVEAYNILQSREAYELHKPWISDHADQYDPAVLERILRGKAWSDEEISRSKGVEAETEAAFESLFETSDVLLLSVSRDIAPPYPMSLEQRTALLKATVPASLAKLPVVTLPVETPQGPLGIQCILPAKRWKEVLSTLLLNLS